MLYNPSASQARHLPLHKGGSQSPNFCVEGVTIVRNFCLFKDLSAAPCEAPLVQKEGCKQPRFRSAKSGGLPRSGWGIAPAMLRTIHRPPLRVDTSRVFGDFNVKRGVPAKAGTPPGQSGAGSVVAAVANDDERENGEPDPVIVKQVAQAVVHNRILLADWQENATDPLPVIRICRKPGSVTRKTSEDGEKELRRGLDFSGGIC